MIRDYYPSYKFPGKNIRKLFFVVITALLRGISSAATGWPYIAPNKAKSTSDFKDALVEFNKLAISMLNDIDEIKYQSIVNYKKSNHKLILGCSKDVAKYIDSSTVDHIFTSPPYLNNFDYSDRTRLELYF